METSFKRGPLLKGDQSLKREASFNFLKVKGLKRMKPQNRKHLKFKRKLLEV